MTAWKRTHVRIVSGIEELDSEGKFEAYTTGEVWNGWVVPHFTQKVAHAVADWANQLAQRSFESDSQDTIQWDANRDAFIINNRLNAAEPAEVVNGIHVEAIGEKLYSVGGNRWVWEYARDDVPTA